MECVPVAAIEEKLKSLKSRLTTVMATMNDLDEEERLNVKIDVLNELLTKHVVSSTGKKPQPAKPTNARPKKKASKKTKKQCAAEIVRSNPVRISMAYCIKFIKRAENPFTPYDIQKHYQHNKAALDWLDRPAGNTTCLRVAVRMLDKQGRLVVLGNDEMTRQPIYERSDTFRRSGAGLINNSGVKNV